MLMTPELFVQEMSKFTHVHLFTMDVPMNKVEYSLCIPYFIAI